MTQDVRPNVNAMSTSSVERRRAEEALARALDANPDIADPTTHAAVLAFVDIAVAEQMLPESVVIAFKATLDRSESLHRFESETREQLRWGLVSTCIERYFTARAPDDVRIRPTPTLRLVREERGVRRDAPETQA